MRSHERLGGGPLEEGARLLVDRGREEVVGGGVPDVQPDRGVERRELDEIDGAEGAGLRGRSGGERLAPQLGHGPQRRDAEDAGPLVGPDLRRALARRRPRRPPRRAPAASAVDQALQGPDFPGPSPPPLVRGLRLSPMTSRWLSTFESDLPRLVGDLEALVRLESPSGDAARVSRLAAWVHDTLRERGVPAELRPCPSRGDALLASVVVPGGGHAAPRPPGHRLAGRGRSPSCPGGSTGAARTAPASST